MTPFRFEHDFRAPSPAAVFEAYFDPACTDEQDRRVQVASREVVTIGPEEDLSEALKLMASYQVRRIPVVDEDNRLVGIVAQADVAREVKDKDSGQLLHEISQTPTGPRV